MCYIKLRLVWIFKSAFCSCWARDVYGNKFYGQDYDDSALTLKAYLKYYEKILIKWKWKWLQKVFKKFGEFHPWLKFGEFHPRLSLSYFSNSVTTDWQLGYAFLLLISVSGGR
jgi:hypothetical protein